MCSTRGTGTLAIMCYTRGTGTLVIICFTREAGTLPLCVAFKRLIHLSLCVTQEGICMRKWHTGQHALLKRVTGMFTSMCYSACLPLCITRLACLLLGVVKWIMCACYYAFLACLQCVAQQAGMHMLANYIRCCVKQIYWHVY